MTIDGDATVPVPSALALAAEDRVEKRWMNLFEYNDNNYDRKHRDILEVPDVIAFIANTIQSTTTIPYEYLSETAPVIVGGERLVFQLHSPLDMSLVAGDGRRVSSSTVEIESATYRRYGELQYISIPRDETVTLQLEGLATGSFTLDIDETNDSELVRRHTYTAIPSTVGTKVVAEIGTTVSLDELLLVVDYDGDGTEDGSYATIGLIPDRATYDELLQMISDLDLKKIPQLLLLTTVRTAEKFYEKSLVNTKFIKQEKNSLQLLQKQVVLYKKLHLISAAEMTTLEGLITRLLNKE